MRAPNEPAEVPPAVVMQKTGEWNMNRYKPLKSSIVNQRGADVEGERQGTSSEGQDQVQTETITIRPSNYETATEYTMAREKEIEANRRKQDTGGNIPQ